MKLYLVRHGRTEDNMRGLFSGARDQDVCPEGLEAVRETAQKLARVKFTRAFSSPKKRCLTTMEEIKKANQFGFSYQVESGLTEMDFGLFEGYPFEELEQKYPSEIQAFLADWQSFTFPEGDDTREFYQRAQGKVKEIAALGSPEENTLLVSHEGFILAAVAGIIHGKLEKMFETRLQNAGYLVIEAHRQENGELRYTLLSEREGN